LQTRSVKSRPAFGHDNRHPPDDFLTTVPTPVRKPAINLNNIPVSAGHTCISRNNHFPTLAIQKSLFVDIWATRANRNFMHFSHPKNTWALSFLKKRNAIAAQAGNQPIDI